MSKYELLHQQLLLEGTCNEENFFVPQPVEYEHIKAVHTPDYIASLRNLTLPKKDIRKIGFPLSEKLVEREEFITQGTVEGSEYALENGIAMNIAGGTHHAYTDHGEAFCLYNDQAVAAKYLLNKGKVQKILMVDLDVHQGNGTAEIFKNEPRVFTFSIHGGKNYPFKKEVSDMDIGLEDGTDDTQYLTVLKETLPNLITIEKPDFIFYLSGVDILKTDKLGRLACTLEGCKERDRFVLQTCKDLSIPLQVSMGGGYSPDIKIIIEAHANTYRVAQSVFF